jgi:hypothetical protein
MFREDELKENNVGIFRVFNKDKIRVSVIYKLAESFGDSAILKHLCNG